MSIMTLPPTEEVLAQPFKVPLGDKKVPRMWSEALEKMRKFENGLSSMTSREIRVSETLPRAFRVSDYSANLSRWTGGVFESLLGDEIGRVEWEGDVARCSFYERQVEKGILNNQHRVIKTVQEMHRPKLDRLPSAIWIPPEGKRRIKVLSDAGFGRALRILRGDLTGESHANHREWTERSALGKAWDQSRQAAADVARQAAATARRAAEGLSVAGRSVASGMDRLTTTFAADPAILLGRDLVIYLWKEQ